LLEAKLSAISEIVHKHYYTLTIIKHPEIRIKSSFRRKENFVGCQFPRHCPSLRSWVTLSPCYVCKHFMVPCTQILQPHFDILAGHDFKRGTSTKKELAEDCTQLWFQVDKDYFTQVYKVLW